MPNLRNDGSHRLDGISVDDLAVEVQLFWSEALQVQDLHLLQNRRFAWKRDCRDWYYKVAALTCRVLEGGQEADSDPSDPGSIPVEKGKKTIRVFTMKNMQLQLWDLDCVCSGFNFIQNRFLCYNAIMLHQLCVS